MPTLDDIIPQAPAAATETPLDAVVPDFKQTQRQGLEGSLFVAGQTTPDKAGEAINVANQYSIDPSFAHDNLDSLKVAAPRETTNIDQLVDHYPGVTEFFQKPENASAGHDDIENLQKIDRGTQVITGLDGHALRTSIGEDWFSRDVASGFNSFQQSLVTFAKAHGWLDQDQAQANLDSLKRESDYLASKQPDYLRSFQKEFDQSGKNLGVSIDQFTTEAIRLNQERTLESLKDFSAGAIHSIGSLLDSALVLASNPRSVVQEAVKGTTEFAPFLALGLGTTVSAPVAGGITALLGLPFFGGQYIQKLKAENPAMSDAEILDKADIYGTGMGVVSSMLPALGGLFQKTGVGLAEPLLMRAARTAAGATTAAAAFTAGEAGSQKLAGEKPKIAETLQSFLFNLGLGAATESIHALKGLKKNASVENPEVLPPEVPRGDVINTESQVVPKQLTTGPEAAPTEPAPPSNRLRYHEDPVQAIQAVAKDAHETMGTLKDLQALSEVGDAVKESKLAKRVPDKMDELLRASGGTGNVYFQSDDWDKYWIEKGMSPAKAADQIMGDGGIAYQQAKESGGNIEIPLSTYVSKVAPTEHYDPLLHFVKTDPAGMKFEDAKNSVDALPETVKQIAEESHADQAKSLAGQIEQELIAAGRPPQEAKAAATIAESRMRARSSITGVSPKEYAAKYKSEIIGPNGPSALAEEPNQILAPGEVPTKITAPEPHVLEQGDLIDFGIYKKNKDLQKEFQDSQKPLYEQGSTNQETQLNRFKARFGVDAKGKKAVAAIEKAQNPKNGPYVLSKATGSLPIPNLKSEPTGTIGKPELQNQFTPEGVDPLAWLDAKLGATKQLIKKHAEKNIPLTINTSSDLIASEDYVAILPKNTVVNMYLGPSDMAVNRALLPSSPSRARQETGGGILRDAGIKVNAIEPTVDSAIKAAGGEEKAAEALKNSIYGVEDAPTSAAEVRPFLQKSIGTPKPRFELIQGGKLFQGPNEGGPRGQIEFGPYKALIKLGEKADASTFIHEAFHLWTKEFVDDFKSLKDSETKTPRQQQFLEDAKALADHVGADSVENMTTDQWEKIAESGEEYLREGKAPSSALQKAFARFKTWINYLYRAMKNARVDLNDKIRGVFDRMLAAEDEMKKEQIAPLFNDAATAGMTENQAAEYNKLKSELKDYSENKLRESLMKDLKRKQSNEYESRRDEIRSQIEAQVNADPTYDVLANLKDGQNADGTPSNHPMKLSKEAVIEEFGKESVSGLPKGIFGEDGLHPDVVAEIFGFHSGEDMLHSIANAPEKQSLIDEMTDAQLKQERPDLIDEPQLTEEAIKAVHNDKRAQILRMELEHLASENMSGLKSAIRQVARRVPTDLEVRSKAESFIESRNIGAIRPYEYYLAEAKASKEAGQLLAKGDIDGAFAAKRKELLNHELFRAASAAQEQIDKSIKQFKKLARSDEDLSKSRDTDLVNAARALVSQYGFGKRPVKLPIDYLEKTLRYDPEKFQTLSDVIGPLSQNAQDYKSLSYGDFTALKDAFDALWSLSKSEKEIEIEGKRIQKELAIQEMGAEFDKIPPGKKKALTNRTKTTAEKRRFDIEEHFARGRIAESLIDQWSRGEINSALRRYLFNPANEGAEKYHLASEALQPRLQEIVDPIRKSLKLKQISAPELGFTFADKSELLTALLHSGNDSNLSKLLRGRGWGAVDEQGILDRSKWDAFIARAQKEGLLTSADYDFAQNIWDLFEELKPEAQKAHHEINGFYFNDITARPLEAFGKEYKGGYVPAKVDSYENRAAQIREERDLFSKVENAWSFPTTGAGFTKGRVEAYAAPLSLDLNLIPQALDWQLRFIHIEPRVKDVAKLLNDSALREKINEIHPYAVHEVLMPWLQRTASQRVTEPGNNKALDRFLGYIRQSTQSVYLTLNVFSAAKRLSGVFPALMKVSPYQLGSAFVDYATSPRKTTMSVRERSDFMKSHVSDQLFRIQESTNAILKEPTVVGKFHDMVRPYQGFLIKIVQHFLDTSVWVAAHNKAVAEAPAGLSIEEIEKRAVREADSAVRLTQGSGFPEHVSKWATGTPGERLFKMFVQHFNTIGNLQVSEQAKAESLRRKILVAATFIGFAASGEILRELLAGRSKNEEKDPWALSLLKASIAGIFGITASALAPTAGPIAAGYMRSMLSDHANPFDYHIDASPALSAITSGLRGGLELKASFMNHKALKGTDVEDLFTLFGLATGAPVAPIGKMIGYSADVNSGRVQSPKDPIDLMRGLTTGRGKLRGK